MNKCKHLDSLDHNVDILRLKKLVWLAERIRLYEELEAGYKLYYVKL